MNNLINRINEIYNQIPMIDISATPEEKKTYLKDNVESINDQIEKAISEINTLNQSVMSDPNFQDALKNIAVRVYNISLIANANKNFNANVPEEKEVLEKVEKMINNGIKLAEEAKKISNIPDNDIDQNEIDRIKTEYEDKIALTVKAANQKMSDLLNRNPKATPKAVMTELEPLMAEVKKSLNTIKNRTQGGNLDTETQDFIQKMQNTNSQMNFDAVYQKVNPQQDLYEYFKTIFADESYREEYIHFMDDSRDLLTSLGGTSSFDIDKYIDFNSRIKIENYTNDINGLVDPTKEINEVIDNIKNKYQDLDATISDINYVIDNTPSSPSVETLGALVNFYDAIYDSLNNLPIKNDNLENIRSLDVLQTKIEEIENLLEKLNNKGITSTKDLQTIKDKIENDYKVKISNQKTTNNLTSLNKANTDIESALTTIANDGLKLPAVISDAYPQLKDGLPNSFDAISTSVDAINDVDTYVNSVNPQSDLVVAKLYDNLLKLIAMSSPNEIEFGEITPEGQTRIIEFMSKNYVAIEKIASKFDGKGIQTAGSNIISNSELETKIKTIFNGKTLTEQIDEYHGIIRYNKIAEELTKLKEIKKTKINKEDQTALDELLNQNFNNSNEILNLIGQLPENIELSEKEVKQLTKIFNYKFSMFKKLTDDPEVFNAVSDKDGFINKMSKDVEVLNKIRSFDKVKEKNPQFEEAYNQAHRRINILRVSHANNIPFNPVTISNPRPKKNRKELLLKGLKKTGVFVLGFGAGVIISCIPGVGAFTMALSAAKITISAINAWTNKHPNGKIAQKLDNVKQNYPTIAGVASEIKKTFQNHPNFNVFINGVSAGYLAGNIFEMVTGRTVIEAIGDQFNQTPTVSTVAEVNSVETATPNTDVAPEVPETTTPVDTPVETTITDSSVNIDTAAVPEVPQHIPTFGEPIDASSIPYGYRAAEHAMNGEPVKMFTDLGHKVHIGNEVTLPNGTKMWALFQDDGVGYGWFKADDVIKAVNEKAADIASGLSR